MNAAASVPCITGKGCEVHRYSLKGRNVKLVG